MGGAGLRLVRVLLRRIGTLNSQQWHRAKYPCPSAGCDSQRIVRPIASVGRPCSRTRDRLVRARRRRPDRRPPARHGHRPYRSCHSGHPLPRVGRHSRQSALAWVIMGRQEDLTRSRAVRSCRRRPVCHGPSPAEPGAPRSWSARSGHSWWPRRERSRRPPRAVAAAEPG